MIPRHRKSVSFHRGGKHFLRIIHMILLNVSKRLVKSDGPEMEKGYRVPLTPPASQVSLLFTTLTATSGAHQVSPTWHPPCVLNYNYHLPWPFASCRGLVEAVLGFDGKLGTECHKRKMLSSLYSIERRKNSSLIRGKKLTEAAIRPTVRLLKSLLLQRYVSSLTAWRIAAHRS